MLVPHRDDHVVEVNGHRAPPIEGHYTLGRLPFGARSRIEYWALTTLQKWRVSRRPALAESRPRGPHDPREAVNRPIPENLLNRVRSLTVAAPGARKNRGGKVGAEQWRTRRRIPM